VGQVTAPVTDLPSPKSRSNAEDKGLSMPILYRLAALSAQ
jgi:hypothetical protein